LPKNKFFINLDLVMRKEIITSEHKRNIIGINEYEMGIDISCMELTANSDSISVVTSSDNCSSPI